MEPPTTLGSRGAVTLYYHHEAVGAGRGTSGPSDATCRNVSDSVDAWLLMPLVFLRKGGRPAVLYIKAKLYHIVGLHNVIFTLGAHFAS